MQDKIFEVTEITATHKSVKICSLEIFTITLTGSVGRYMADEH